MRPLVQANEVERIFAEVDPDRRDGFRPLLRWAHCMRPGHQHSTVLG
jgi:hypothetical protein